MKKYYLCYTSSMMRSWHNKNSERVQVPFDADSREEAEQQAGILVKKLKAEDETACDFLLLE